MRLFENCDHEFMPKCVGQYDIPLMRPSKCQLNEHDKFVRFCDWRHVNNISNSIAHFYYDDYKFIAAWRKPEKYLAKLKWFKAVVAPDFSLYTDFPKTLQILSCYRRQWLGAYWQDNGIDVIPCVLWGDTDTYDFCFDGIPAYSVVSVSTVGIKRKPDWNGRRSDIFKRGYDEMIRRLKPSKVLLYGKMVDGIDESVTVQIPSFYDERRSYLNKLWKEKKEHGNWT